jgi:hypothetical protein
LYSRSLICALVLIIVNVFQTIAAIGQVSHDPGSDAQLAKTPTPKRKTLPTTADRKLPACPPGRPSDVASGAAESWTPQSDALVECECSVWQLRKQGCWLLLVSEQEAECRKNKILRAATASK